MKKILVVIICLALVSFSNCNKGKFTLILTIDDTGATGTHTAYAKLVTKGASETATAEYSGNASVKDGLGIITIEDIEQDTYTGYVFIDIDDDAASASYLADTGDRATSSSGINIEIDDDKSVTVDTAWGWTTR